MDPLTLRAEQLARMVRSLAADVTDRHDRILALDALEAAGLLDDLAGHLSDLDSHDPAA